MIAKFHNVSTFHFHKIKSATEKHCGTPARHTDSAPNKVLENSRFLSSRNFHFENQIPFTDLGGFLAVGGKSIKERVRSAPPGRCGGECVHPYPGHGSRRTGGDAEWIVRASLSHCKPRTRSSVIYLLSFCFPIRDFDWLSIPTPPLLSFVKSRSLIRSGWRTCPSAVM